MSMTEITAGEVARGLELIRGDIKELGAEVRERPDWQDIRRVESGLVLQIANEKAARVIETAAITKAIAQLEEWNAWAVRIAFGAAATGVIGWAVAAALNS